MKNIEVNDIPNLILPLLGKLKRYVVLVFILVFLIVYGFLVWQIDVMSRVEPDDDEVLASQTAFRRPKINDEAIDKILQLEARNIDITSSFQETRVNPFAECTSEDLRLGLNGCGPNSQN